MGSHASWLGGRFAVNRRRWKSGLEMDRLDILRRKPSLLFALTDNGINWSSEVDLRLVVAAIKYLRQVRSVDEHCGQPIGNLPTRDQKKGPTRRPTLSFFPPCL